MRPFSFKYGRNRQKRFITGETRYVEIFLVGDRSLVAKHRSDTYLFMLTMMNMVGSTLNAC